VLAPVQLVSRVIQVSGDVIGGKGLFSVELKCERKRKNATVGSEREERGESLHYNAISSTSTASKFTSPPIVSKEMPSDAVAGNIRSEITTWPSPP
jgi:hypothetical protein